MSIESEVFKKERLNKVKLEQYGFVKENDEYKYSKNFMHDNFRADIVIDKNGKVSGKVFDLEVNEEYTSFRIESVVGEFVNRVKKEYINILKDIAVKCFEKQYFVNDQSNRITKLIKEKYDVEPEFLWEKFPNYAVFRNARSEKWFGAIMDIDRSKIIPNQEGDTEILDIKLDDETEKYLKYRGIYPAYHMSKKSWITIILDDSLKDEEILKLIDISFQSSNVKGEWIIPANPKYYDVIGAFEHSDTLTWKQTKGMMKGDSIYIYFAKPYSAILFKCVITKTDIPYEYEDENVCMSKVIEIKLVKRYKEDEFTLDRLKELGVKSVRGPRSITSKLRYEFLK